MATGVFCVDLKFASDMTHGVKAHYPMHPTTNILTLVQNWWELSTVIDYAKMRPSGNIKGNTIIAAKEIILVKQEEISEGIKVKIKHYQGFFSLSSHAMIYQKIAEIIRN